MNEYLDVVLTEAAKLTLSRAIASLRKKKPDEVSPALVEARLQSLASSIVKVKTLLSTERAIDISAFYCSPRVTSSNRTFRPKGADDFKDDHVLIEGIAGQGKSTLLRYLASEAILKEGRIAFFYELRKLDHSKPLERIILESMSDIGLPSRQEALKQLTTARGIEIYLDGFDELTQKEIVKVERDIDRLVQNYPFARLFVTARPHAGLGLQSNLARYRIEPLNTTDSYQIIDKLLSEQKTLAAEIKDKLSSHSGNIQALLETPLLVTLLVSRYSQTREMPRQLTDFYKSIFDTLFERHDHFKVTFKRHRRLQLSSAQYLSTLQKFSYASLMAVQLDDATAEKLADWALRDIPNTNSTDFLLDIAEITSILLHEARAWAFLHSSIQEYYAACHILSNSDSEIERQSSKLVLVKNRSAREQVFKFAEELDNFRYANFVALPYLKRALEPLEPEQDIDEAAALSWLRHNISSIRLHKVLDPDGKHFSVYTRNEDMKPISLYVSNSQFSKLDPLTKSEQDLPKLFDGLTTTSRQQLVNHVFEFLVKAQEAFLEQRKSNEHATALREKRDDDLMSLLAE